MPASRRPPDRPKLYNPLATPGASSSTTSTSAPIHATSSGRPVEPYVPRHPPFTISTSIPSATTSTQAFPSASASSSTPAAHAHVSPRPPNLCGPSPPISDYSRKRAFGEDDDSERTSHKRRKVEDSSALGDGDGAAISDYSRKRAFGEDVDSERTSHKRRKVEDGSAPGDGDGAERHAGGGGGGSEAGKDAKESAEAPNATDSTHIPRPANCFMLFRKAFVSTLKGIGKTRQSKMSKIAGDAWKALSKEQKRVYEDEAAEVKKQHKLAYPDWKYQPQRRSRKDKEKKAERRHMDKRATKKMAKGVISRGAAPSPREFAAGSSTPATIPSLPELAAGNCTPATPAPNPSTLLDPSPVYLELPPSYRSSLSHHPSPPYPPATPPTYHQTPIQIALGISPTTSPSTTPLRGRSVSAPDLDVLGSPAHSVRHSRSSRQEYEVPVAGPSRPWYSTHPESAPLATVSEAEESVLDAATCTFTSTEIDVSAIDPSLDSVLHTSPSLSTVLEINELDFSDLSPMLSFHRFSSDGHVSVPAHLADYMECSLAAALGADAHVLAPSTPRADELVLEPAPNSHLVEPRQAPRYVPRTPFEGIHMCDEEEEAEEAETDLFGVQSASASNVASPSHLNLEEEPYGLDYAGLDAALCQEDADGESVNQGQPTVPTSIVGTDEDSIGTRTQSCRYGYPVEGVASTVVEELRDSEYAEGMPMPYAAVTGDRHSPHGLSPVQWGDNAAGELDVTSHSEPEPAYLPLSESQLDAVLAEYFAFPGDASDFDDG